MLLAGIYVPFARAMLVLPYTEQLSAADILEEPLVPEELDAPLVGTVVEVEVVDAVVVYTINGESNADCGREPIDPPLETVPPDRPNEYMLENLLSLLIPPAHMYVELPGRSEHHSENTDIG